MNEKLTLRFKKLSANRLENIKEILSYFGEVSVYDQFNQYTNVFIVKNNEAPNSQEIKSLLKLQGYHPLEK